MLLYGLTITLDRRAPWQHAHDRDEDYRTKERNQDGHEIDAAEEIRTEDHARQEAAEQRSENTDDDITDDSVAAALHDHAGQPTGNQTDDQPSDDTHGMSSLRGLRLIRRNERETNCVLLHLPH